MSARILRAATQTQSHTTRTLKLFASTQSTARFSWRPQFANPYSASAYRSMSTKLEFLVTIPDHPSSLDKRLAVREAHLKNLKPHIESGDVVFGGAMLSSHPEDGQGPDMTGSVMLIKAESEEKVKEWIRSDAYTKGGVWDVDSATITPFRCAVRTAM